MALRAAVLALVLVAGVAACGESSETRGQGQQQAACPPAGLRTVQGGLLRMPAGARPGRTPLLVVVIPGGDGDRSDRLGVGRSAGRAGMAVLYPTSEGSGFWTLNDEQGRQDVEDVSGLLDRTLGGGCFDRDRVSITGVSNGAGFATRMGCEEPERFAAVIPVAAGFRALDPCSSRTSFLAIHGTADTVVPYNGKRPDRAGSVPRFTARWAGRAGCSGSARTSTPRRLVTRYTYRGCDNGARVQLVRLTGTVHGWPGSTGRRRPTNPSGFRASPEVVRFATSSRAIR